MRVSLRRRALRVDPPEKMHTELKLDATDLLLNSKMPCSSNKRLRRDSGDSGRSGRCEKF